MGLRELCLVLAVLLALALAAGGAAAVRLWRMRRKLKKMEGVLEEVRAGNGNRRLLIPMPDPLAPLAYRINEIVYAYEEKLVSLQKADETSKMLMTSLSHDVRTPLTTLIGYLDAIHSGLVSGAEREEYLETARRKAHDLKDYIDVLFDWFRLNSNEFTLTPQAVEAAELTRNLLKDWVPVFREKGVDFEISIPDSRISIEVDLDGYARIVNNLIQNAMTHSKASLLTITMAAEGGFMRLCVRDNGVGIAKEDLSHIFDRLYKCDKSRGQKGSGLGLSIVHEIAQRMGGRITAASEVGVFTAFTVEFPLVQLQG